MSAIPAPHPSTMPRPQLHLNHRHWVPFWHIPLLVPDQRKQLCFPGCCRCLSSSLLTSKCGRGTLLIDGTVCLCPRGAPRPRAALTGSEQLPRAWRLFCPQHCPLPTSGPGTELEGNSHSVSFPSSPNTLLSPSLTSPPLPSGRAGLQDPRLAGPQVST